MTKLFGRICSKAQSDIVNSVSLEYELRAMREDCQDYADNYGSSMTDKEYLSLMARIQMYTVYIDFLSRSK